MTLSGPAPRLLNRLLLRPALAMRLRIQRAIEEAGFEDFRIAHMNVFAWLPDSGARIGELARQAQLSKQTMTELVSYLEKHGLDQVARRALRDTEAKWAQALGQRAYAQLRKHLESLLEVAEATREVQDAPFADLSDNRPLLPEPTRARTPKSAGGGRSRSKPLRKQLR